MTNLKKNDDNPRTYMTMADFSFMWDLAANIDKNRMTATSAVAICQLMQTFMVKRDPQYRGVAEKIFFKLMGNFPQEEKMQVFMQEHANQAINELASVDHMLKISAGQSSEPAKLNLSGIS